MRKTLSALSVLAILAAGCDPEAPVQSSDVAAEIDGKIAVHAADSSTHNNLLVAAANVSGEFDGDQIQDGSIGIADLGSGSVGSDEIADQSISVDDLGASSVGALQLVDNSISTAKIADSAVTASKIAAGSVSGGLAGAIADNTIGTADIENQSIAAADIANDTITGTQIANNILDDADIVDNGLDDTSLAANSVTDSELADNAVDAGAIAANAVTSGKIMNANVTAAKLADGAVTAFGGKLSAPDVLGSGTMGAFTTAFTMRVPNNGTVIRVVAGCESDKPMSMLRLQDNNQMIDVTCPDTDLMGPMSLFILEITTNMAAEDVLFRYKSEANGDTTRWRIFSVTAQ